MIAILICFLTNSVSYLMLSIIYVTNFVHGKMGALMFMCGLWSVNALVVAAGELHSWQAFRMEVTHLFFKNSAALFLILLFINFIMFLDGNEQEEGSI